MSTLTMNRTSTNPTRPRYHWNWAAAAIAVLSGLGTTPVVLGGVSITFLQASSYDVGGFVQQDDLHFNITQPGLITWFPPTAVSSSVHVSYTDTLGPAFFSSDLVAAHNIAATATSLSLQVEVNTAVLASVASGWPQGQAQGYSIDGYVAADFTLTTHSYYYLGDNVLSEVGTSNTFPSGTVLTPSVYYFSRTMVGGGCSITAFTGESKSASNSASLYYSFVQCGADFDLNGFINGDDFDAYVLAYIGGFISADFDGNGFVNGDDFDAFVAAFVIGC